MWIIKLYTEQPIAFFITGVACTLFLIAFIVGFATRIREIYTSLAIIVGGIAALLSSAYGLEEKVTLNITAFLVTLGAVLSLFLYGFLALRNGIIERKKRRAAITRRLEFALPDRDNEYLRERLQTALAPEKTENESKPPCFTHARLLLSKIKQAPLTGTERLELDELSAEFALYLVKPTLTAEDIRAVNDLFSRILKLSAKYA